MSLCWMTSAFNFNLIGFLLKYSPGSFFVNSSMSALSEVAAALVASLIYNKFGIRKAFVISFAISALGGCGILWYKTHTDFYVRRPSIDSWTFPCLVIFAKFGISSALLICFICNLDLWPALFAHKALIFSNFPARIATIFSPEVAEIQSLLPMILFSSLSIMTMFTSMLIRVKAT